MALYLRPDDDGDPRHELLDYSLRVTMMSMASAGLQSVAMTLHAWQGDLSWWTLAAFLLVAPGVPALFALLIGSGLSLRVKQSTLLPLHAVAACAVQLGFLLVAPQLSLLFLFGIMITFNTFMLGTAPRHLTRAWLAVAVASGAALWFVRERFRYPGLDDLGLYALWLYFFLAVRQLTGVGVRCGILRSVLYDRRLRLSQTVARLHERAGDERVLERERISRELHDTLLQGVQALVLRIHAAHVGIPRELAARRMVERGLARADQVIVDARDRLTALREGPGAGHDPVGFFSDSVRAMAHDFGVRANFRVTVQAASRTRGGSRSSPMADEVARVGRELVVNAFRYAGVGSVDVQLELGAAFVGLRLHERHGDFVPSRAEREAHDDGVQALSARARSFGAEIVVAHAHDGLEVLMKVPNAVAFRCAGAAHRNGVGRRSVDAAA